MDKKSFQGQSSNKKKLFVHFFIHSFSGVFQPLRILSFSSLIVNKFSTVQSFHLSEMW